MKAHDSSSGSITGRVCMAVGVLLAALVVPVVTATSASAATCSPTITSTISGTWRLHVSADINSAGTGASLSPGNRVTIDAQAMNPAGAVTVSGFGTSAVLDHVAGGWFSDLGSTATPYQVLAPSCQGSPPPPPPPPPPVGGSIGGVNMQAGCDRQYGGQGRTATVLDSHNAYSWVCQSGGSNAGVDVNQACSDQYGPGATSGLADAGNPWTWYCRWTGRTWGIASASNGGYAGQCTNWAEAQFKSYTGQFGGWSGNAFQWRTNAQAKGWATVDDAQAKSIVVFQPGIGGSNRQYGHVAWVDSVERRPDGLWIHISEMNWTAPYVTDTRVIKDIPGMSYILAPKP